MANKIKCTCGHSWNKSDSSKKDMYVCHVCGNSNVPKAQVGDEIPASKVTPEMIKGWGEYRNYLGEQGLYGDPRLNTAFGKKTFIDWATKNPNYGVNWETLPIIGQELAAHKQKVKEAVGRGKVSLSTPVSEFNATDKANLKSKNPWWPGTEFTAQEFAEYEEKVIDPKGNVIKEKNFGVLPSTETYDKDRLDKSVTKSMPLRRNENGGWLDKYEDGGEFLGTTNKGFNYNGAWGGPSMQNGGIAKAQVGDLLPMNPSLMNLGIDAVSKIINLLSPSSNNTNNTNTNTKAKSKSKSTTLPETLEIKDPRKIRKTTGKPINPNVDLVSGKYNTFLIKEALEDAKKYGLSKEDAWNLAAIGFQESGWGKTDSNLGHIKGNISAGDTENVFLNAYLNKMREADRLKITDPEMRLQVYNGLGLIKPETEKDYHKFEMKKIYGVPVPKEGLSMKKNPLYGRQVIDIRDNVLRQNPEVVNYIESLYGEEAPKKEMGGDVPTMQHGGIYGKLNFLEPTSKKLPEGYNPSPEARGSSTEYAVSIGGEDGEPAYLIPSFKYGELLLDPKAEFRRTGDYLGGPFKTYQEADEWERTVRHPYVEKGQTIPTPIKRWGDMAMGGSLPGSVGFTYARTGSIPDNGPYAKKTLASAQNGASIPVIEDIGDFKQGVWVPDLKAMAKQAKKLGAKKVKTKSGSVLYFNDKWEAVSANDAPSAQDGTDVKKPVVKLSPEELKMERLKQYAQKASKKEQPIVQSRGSMPDAVRKQLYEDAQKAELKNQLLKGADVATDVMQFGNFVPNPIGQAIGTAGNILGGWIDAYQVYNDYNKGDYTNAAVNAASVALPMMLGSSTFRRNSKYLRPGQPLNFLKGNERVKYIEPFNKVKGMTDKSLMANRALLGSLGAETVYDSYQNGGEMKFYQEGLDWKPRNISRDGSEIPKAQVGTMVTPLDFSKPLGTLEGVSEVMSAPARTATYILTGKYQDPSQALGIKNPIGAFITDAILDPVNLLGAAIATKAAKSAKDVAKIAVNTAKATAQHIDKKYIYPRVFKKEIEELKRVHKLAPKRYASPEAAKRLKGVFNIDPATMEQPMLTFEPHIGSYYSSLGNNINLDLRQVNKLKRTELTSPKAVYEHEYGHFLQREADKNSQSFLNKIKEYEENLAKYKSPENQKLLSDVDLWLTGKNKDKVVFNPGLKPEPLSNPTIIDNYASRVYKVDPVTNQISNFPTSGEARKYASYFPYRKVEPLAHLREMRQNMIDKGYIKNDYSPISRKTIRKFIEENPEDRISSFTSPTDKNRIKGLEQIFKNLPAIVPAVGIGAAATVEQKKEGGVIKDDRGQWAHPGEITEIGSPYITMEGVPYPVLGISDTGDVQMMYPGKDYKFKGKKVTEYPVGKKWLEKYK